jgi:hypothetical protein
MPRLEKWKILDNERLYGYIYDDDERHDSVTTEFQDGHRVVTSPVKIMADDESYAITRSGTKYILGVKLKPTDPDIERL